MRYRLIIWFVLLVCVPTLQASNLGAELNELIRGADLGQTEVSFCVVDIDNHQTIARSQADRPMIPASNMKLITTAAALAILGPDYIFTTELGLIESASTDTPPDLIVTADGDPAFGDPVLLLRHGFTVDDIFEQWVEAVRATGKTQFKALRIDDRVFDYQFVHSDWSKADQIKQYGAQVAGLNFHRNCLDVIVSPTIRGQSPRVSLYPKAPFIHTINRSVTGSRDFFTLDRRLGTNEIVFGGQIKNKQFAPFYITVHDPAMIFGQLLVDRLRQAGITVQTIERLGPQETISIAKPLHRISTTLKLVLERTNQNSQNMFAEALFKRVGRAVTGEPGSWDNGASAIRFFLQEKLRTRSAAIVLADGSGLSRNNRVTTRLLCDLLTIMHDDPVLAEPYRLSLSRGGREGIGTLKDRFQKVPAQIYGKSGYIRGVSSLSGYIVTPQGPDGQVSRTLAFSFLFNGYKSPISNGRLKALQDRMLDTTVAVVVNHKPHH